MKAAMSAITRIIEEYEGVVAVAPLSKNSAQRAAMGVKTRIIAEYGKIAAA